MEHREHNLSPPFFVIQPASHETGSDTNTMTTQFDISGGVGWAGGVNVDGDLFMKT
jgi:hypothetical protein